VLKRVFLSCRERAMILELKPEQQRVLDRAAQSGMSPDELLDQAFAVIHEQHRNGDWMLAERETVAAHVAEGFAQAERGELAERMKQVEHCKTAGYGGGCMAKRRRNGRVLGRWPGVPSFRQIMRRNGLSERLIYE
jgi:hypothetical protein